MLIEKPNPRRGNESKRIAPPSAQTVTTKTQKLINQAMNHHHHHHHRQEEEEEQSLKPALKEP